MMVNEYDTQSTFAYFFKISRKWNLIFTHLKLKFRKNVIDENRLRMRFYNKKMMSQVRIPKNWKIEGVWHTLLYNNVNIAKSKNWKSVIIQLCHSILCQYGWGSSIIQALYYLAGIYVTGGF